ncbi:MAG: UDP-N-acetylmuramate--L-alanine ligase [Candidatus Eisenbacteria sp.]|nr:UDP-N-acetylmuramate--L-alanine ligase [Candidatus Eisenbacteria bacterium]
MQGVIQRTHFVGIGGTGMCGLAEILLTLDYAVSGSDLVTGTEAVERLERMGARIHAGHAAEYVRGSDLVVVSSAVGEENPEVCEARRLGLPVLLRGEMLAEIMRLKYGIAVAGAHGKTTTTSLIGHVLCEAGLDPTVIVGGRLRALGSNARMGAGDIFVAEADESDGSFLQILPTVAVITNIDREHLDHYGSLEKIRAAFLRFARGVPFYGVVVACGEDPHLRELLPEINKPVVTYGRTDDCRVQLTSLVPTPRGSRFGVAADGRDLGEFAVPLPGIHNALNALACVAVALFLGVPAARIRETLGTFAGVARRFELRGESHGVTVIDDYGHHPTEIAAVLRSAREVFPGRRLVVLFQPHRYSRTAALAAEFAQAFRDADLVLLSEIYAAGETPLPGVTSAGLCDPIRRASRVELEYVADEDRAIERCASILGAGDVLITLGAGTVSQWGDRILARLGSPGCAASAVVEEQCGARPGEPEGGGR